MRLGCRAAGALAALLLTGAAPLPADANRRAAEAAQAARQRAMDRDESRAGAAAAGEEVDRLRDQLLALGRGEAQGEAALQEKGRRLSALNAAEKDLADRMGRNQSALERLLGALQLYGRNPPPALLVSPRSATDAVNAAILLKALEPELARRAAAFAKEAEALKTLRRKIALENGEILSVASEAQDRREQIVRLISEKTALERRLNHTAEAADAEVKTLAARARALGVEPQDLPGTSASSGGDLRLQPPVRGSPVRRFGESGPGGRRSAGWTWRTAPGETVLAPAEGRVAYAGVLKGWGTVVILRLSNDHHLVLAGLGGADARMGASVSVGEPIGHMAASSALGDDKSAPELYLELRKGDAPVDPARWLERTTARRAP